MVRDLALSSHVAAALIVGGIAACASGSEPASPTGGQDADGSKLGNPAGGTGGSSTAGGSNGHGGKEPSVGPPMNVGGTRGEGGTTGQDTPNVPNEPCGDGYCSQYESDYGVCPIDCDPPFQVCASTCAKWHTLGCLAMPGISTYSLNECLADCGYADALHVQAFNTCASTVDASCTDDCEDMLRVPLSLDSATTSTEMSGTISSLSEVILSNDPDAYLRSVQWFETWDDPCKFDTLYEDVNSLASSASSFTMAGKCATPSDDRTVMTAGQRAISRLQVCQGAYDKVKGIRIGSRFASRTDPIVWLDSPGYSEGIHPNCSTWSNEVSCPDGEVGVGLTVSYDDKLGATGLGLVCRKVKPRAAD